jgi:WD40-like Beta Propeller Repeat
MTRGPDPATRLRDIRVPGEEEAEQRSWEIVRTAYEERTPARPVHRARRLALALGGGLAALAIVLSPAGAKVGDLVSDVVGIGEEDAKPALRSLPAAGELLVESEQGPWIVREDGSKRLLGDYGEASWSQPRGLYVAATDGRTLLAVEPDGTARWTITAPGSVHDPRWAPSGVRVAYRSAGDLWVVNGDGSDPRRIARNVAPVPPAWRALDPKSKLGGASGNVLTYVTSDKEIHTVDVDTSAAVSSIPRDLEILGTPPEGGTGKRATSPDRSRLATLEHVGRRDELVLSSAEDGRAVVFSARGMLTGPTWSPDGRWLLVGWPAADQWLFIDADRPRHVIAFDSISEQFDPGGAGAGAFPHVSGWILPQR